MPVVIELLLILAFTIVPPFYCAYVARQKGRSAVLWFIIGLVLSIFGVIGIHLNVPSAEQGSSPAPPSAQAAGSICRTAMPSPPWSSLTSNTTDIAPLAARPTPTATTEQTPSSYAALAARLFSPRAPGEALSDRALQLTSARWSDPSQLRHERPATLIAQGALAAERPVR
jgi:hypothetical protein